MKFCWKKLLISILIPLIIGALSSLITKNSMGTFNTLNKPSLSPPGWIFPIAWTLLYVMIGISSYLIFNSNINKYDKIKLLQLYSLQLFFNFMWSPIFFNLKLYYLAFIWLIILWLLVFIMIIKHYKTSRLSSYLLIPYLLWLTFAGYLNIAIAVLN